MKLKKIRSVLALVLALAVVLSLVVVTATAETDATVTFDSSAKQFVFDRMPYTLDDNGHPDTDNAETHLYPDLFPDMKNMMPGDTVEQKITVKATGLSSGDKAVISLKVQPTHTDPTTDPSSGQTKDDTGAQADVTDPEKENYASLLANWMTVKVYKGDSTDESNLIQDGDLSSGVQLATFSSGSDPVDLTVQVTLDIKAGNEFQDLQAAIAWVFTANYTAGGGGGGGGGGDTPDPTPPGPKPDDLNTDDHFAYIVGYPEDYETGEYTEDESRKAVRPERNITRAEVATIFFRLLTDESRQTNWSQSNDYSDVASSDWYNNAVSTLSNAGILKGYEDGTFKPNGYITRAEFATIATRFFDFQYEGDDFFSDIASHWAREYINQAADNGLVNGYPDGTFGPQRNITRAEAVTMVNRVLLRYPDKDKLLDDMRKWPDNMDTSKWYYADIQEASNSHDYDRDTDGKTEIWTEILPNRDWAALEKEWSVASRGNGESVIISSLENAVFKD